MRIIKTLPLLACSCMLLNSCGSTECPAFPEHLADYFPYKKGDSLVFVSTKNDTIVYYVDAVEKTEKETNDNCGKCTCGQILAFSSVTEGLKNVLMGAIEINSQLLSVSFNNSNLSYLVPPNTPIEKQLLPAGSIHLYVYALPNKDPFNPKDSLLFGKTVVLEKAACSISKAIVVKGLGITEFYSKSDSTLWTKAN